MEFNKEKKDNEVEGVSEKIMAKDFPQINARH